MLTAADQLDLFTPAPCRACGETPAPHWLANYIPPVWVVAHGPMCGPPVYAPSRDAVVIEWNEWTASRPKEEPN